MRLSGATERRSVVRCRQLAGTRNAGNCSVKMTGHLELRYRRPLEMPSPSACMTEETLGSH